MIIEIASRGRELADRRSSKAIERQSERQRHMAHRRSTPLFKFPSYIGWYASTRWIAEFLVGLVLAVLAAPLVLVSAILVKLTSRGPAFYTQTRVGLNGRPFKIYKIRTMVHECESITGPRWSIPGDPRITRIGHILRKTHLDELPQLLNVLRGEMGLIGPRPERPEFVPRLARVLPQYRERLSVRPGITGLAQVHFAADTDLESVRRKLTYDLYYVGNIRFGLDVRILLATALYALGSPRGLSRKIAGVPVEDVVECRLLADETEEESVRLKRCA